MNITESLIARIEDYRATNKQPCKNYATEAAAVKAMEKAVADGQNYFGTDKPARYVVFFNPAWGRWCAGIDMSEYMRRSDFGGGYIGFFTGFFTY